MTKKVNLETVGVVVELLCRAASAVKVAQEAGKAVQDQKGGAYSLYVKAGIAAGNSETFTVASDTLFSEIRKTGQAGGKPCGAVKAKGEAGGFTVPMSISAAKSYIGTALASSIPLTETKKGKKEPRSFTAIRNDVMALKKQEREKEEAEKVAKMEDGTEKTRLTDGQRVVAELADLIAKEENALDLKDLIARVDAAMRDYGHESEEAEPVVALVEAAADKPAKKNGGRRHSDNRQAA